MMAELCSGGSTGAGQKSRRGKLKNYNKKKTIKQRCMQTPGKMKLYATSNLIFVLKTHTKKTHKIFIYFAPALIVCFGATPNFMFFIKLSSMKNTENSAVNHRN